MPALRRAPGARSLSAVFGRHWLVILVIVAVFSAAVSMALIGEPPPSERHLLLSLAPVAAQYTSSEPLLVRLTLMNTAALSASFENAVFFVLVKRLSIGGGAPEDWPYLECEFEITDPDGRLLVATPRPPPDRLVEPQLAWFDELHAGEFFGRTVDLRTEWLGFRFEKMGRYRVIARLKTGARAWVDAWLRQNKKSGKALPFSYQHVFGGSLVSEPAEFTLAPSGR